MTVEFQSRLFGAGYTGLFAPSVLGALIYGLALLVVIYVVMRLLGRRAPLLKTKQFVFTILLFIIFGAIGEDVVNTLWRMVFGAPLWTYQLYPQKSGNISAFFPVVWGVFGFYSYLRDHLFPRFLRLNALSGLMIFGLEAILIELLVNVPFFAIFGSYIFYYHPENLGIFSHFSCLQVIPFYMAVAIATRKIILQQKIANFAHFKTTMAFYLMLIISYGYL